MISINKFKNRLITRILLPLSVAIISLSGVDTSTSNDTFTDIFPDLTIKVEAADELPTTGSSFDVFIDEENNVCIVTNDQKRTGSIYYRTEGFHISKGKFNPSARELANGTATENFYLPLNDSLKVTYTIGRREINIFKYPFSLLKSMMSSDWLQDIEDAEKRGMTAYIRFDAQMVVYAGILKLPHSYINNPPVDGRNPAELQGAFTWSAGANTGIKSHYNRWLPISSKSVVLPDTGLLTDWHITKQTTNGPGVGAGTSTLTYSGDYTGDPKYAGGNANLDGYDAAYGVPSTKTITGYAESSPWYGNIDVWARLVTHQYKKTDTYEWRVDKEDKGADLTTAYDGAPIKDTGAIRSTVNKAFDDIYKAIKAEEDRLRPLLKKGHDSDLNDIFTYTVKLRFVDDENQALAGVGGTDSEGCITIEVSSRTVERVVPIPIWQNGWTWTERTEKWKVMEDNNGNLILDENGEAMYWRDPEDAWNYTTHTVTWTRYNEDKESHKPQPSSDIVAGPTELYTNGSLVYCGWRLDAKNIRKFFDDNNNVQDDEFVQAYASFNYIDPYLSNVYDLNSVTLYNDIYGSTSFSQVVDTQMDAQKGAIKSEKTVPFDDWLELHKGAASITSDKIATSDYIKWAEIEDEEKGKLTLSYNEDDEQLKLYISQNTKSVNDYVYIKNPIDNGPADGIYLGNSAAKEYGVVKGCDFRDAENLDGYTSIDKALLSGTDNVVKDDEIYEAGNDISKYWYLCTHSAGGNVEHAKAYTSDNQSKLAGTIDVWEKLGYQTVQIDPQTANGAHSTGISTLFVQEMIGPTTATSTVQYADEVSAGHLYSNEFDSSGTVHGYSHWGGLMGSAEGGMDENGNLLVGPGSVPSVDGGATGDVSYIVDPVHIHTPIMSPGTVTNASGKETSRQAAQSDSTPVTRENVSTSNTSLYRDLSSVGTSQLRLDSYYYIKWQDLSDIAKTHRQTATPKNGGYASQTDDDSTGGLEEDEFTKAKYFKFPFEVMYAGKFYKPNQWIEVLNPNSYGDDGDESYNDAGYLRDANPTVAGDDADIPGELLSENHWVMTPFYIPAWATEGLYEEIRNSDPYHPRDLTTCAQLRVDAVNVVSSDGIYRADQMQEIANENYNVSTVPYNDGAAYVAQFNFPVQLSGWIYDFTITGISDVDTFSTTLTSDQIASTNVYASGEYAYSFTANKQDKKSGTLNRLGYNGIRYLKDGRIENDWKEINTISLVGQSCDSTNGKNYSGKSNAWPTKGSVVKGTTFAFTLKTMSNMWNFNGRDSIEIKPTFTYYIYKDGAWKKTENENLKVYYHESDNNMFVPYGSNNDINNVRGASLGDEQFDESYYTEADLNPGKTFADWIWYNTYMYDLKYNLIPVTMTLEGFKNAYNTDVRSLTASGALIPEDWLGDVIDEYCISHISIPERMRLLSGEADQLRPNIIYGGKEGSDLVTLADMAEDYTKEYETSFDSENKLNLTDTAPEIIINGATEETTIDDKMRYSIQSWYGKYFVPEDLMVVNLEEHPEYRDFSDPLSPYHAAYQTNGGFVYGSDLGDPGDSNKYHDYIEYYVTKQYENGSTASESDDVFIQKGFLTVNFDIIGVKDGESHLLYDGGNIGEEGSLEETENENNTWKTENYKEVPDTIDEPVVGQTDEGSPTDPGDVVVIDLSKKFSDRFGSAIFNTN